jgi:hypothetical protein
MKTEDVITTVDVLMRMNRVDKKAYEDWRFGRIPCLERVFLGSLGKANRILRILRLHAESLQLVPSQTVYRKWGKGKNKDHLAVFKIGPPEPRKGVFDTLSDQESYERE